MDLDDGRAPELDDRGGRRRSAPRRRGDPRRRLEPAPRRPVRASAIATVEPLEVYERNGDGHTLLRHCDVTPGADARRLAAHPGLLATGSFANGTVAQRCTEACVEANHEEVLEWLGGDDARLAIGLDMVTVIGSVLRRERWLAGETTPEPATAVVTVLRRNQRYPSGFAVRTSYPVRHQPPPRPIRVPIEESTP